MLQCGLNSTVMKKISLLFIAGAAALQGYAQEWQNVGNAGFSAGEADYVSLVIDGSGTPYIAYEDGDNSDKATVMKYDGTSWVPVGAPGFSDGAVNNLSLAIDLDTPYIAYSDANNSGKITAMKFNGTSWETVGDAGFSASYASNTSLAIGGSDTLYVAYLDGGNSGKATVMKYNGTSWEVVGNADFSTMYANDLSLAVDGKGTPYVAYSDYVNYNKATVMKYNSTNMSWEAVGGLGFSAGNASFTSLAIDGSGTPYVAYEDAGNSNKATVMKYSSTSKSWEAVGSPGFSAGRTDYESLVVNGGGVPYVAYEDEGNSNKATVMKYNSTSENWETIGSAGFSASNAIYTSLAIDGNGTPYVAYSDGQAYGSITWKATVMAYENGSLPVTLVSFSGNLQNGVASLQWSTGVEDNFSHFEIEKSADGLSFQPEGEVFAKGGNSSYSFSIPQSETTAYYRMKIMDNDGGGKYSNIIRLSQSSSSNVTLYPNPATVYINVTVAKAGVLSIYDAGGRLMKMQTVQSGVNNIDVSALGAGVYYAEVGGEKVAFLRR